MPARVGHYCSATCEQVIERLLHELRADVEHARAKRQLCEAEALRPRHTSASHARRTAGRWRVRVEALDREIADLLIPPTTTKGTT